MGEDCIFCKIAAGEVPTELIYEDADVVAFNDISPDAPVHVLIVPKRHYATTLEMADDNPEGYVAMMKAAATVARMKKVDRSGFRLILNTNADAGQIVWHVHMHLLGGEPLGKLRCTHATS